MTRLEELTRECAHGVSMGEECFACDKTETHPVYADAAARMELAATLLEVTVEALREEASYLRVDATRDVSQVEEYVKASVATQVAELERAARQAATILKGRNTGH